MRKAIQKAIDGGWGGIMKGYPLNIDIMPSIREPFPTVHFVRKGVQSSVWLHSILLDPRFWQALGKTERWDRISFKQSIPARVTSRVIHGKVIKVSNVAHIRMMKRPNPMGWKKYFHRFIDHLISGGNVDAFFKEILK